jgi:hypothetical protein
MSDKLNSRIYCFCIALMLIVICIQIRTGVGYYNLAKQSRARLQLRQYKPNDKGCWRDGSYITPHAMHILYEPITVQNYWGNCVTQDGVVSK